MHHWAGNLIQKCSGKRCQGATGVWVCDLRRGYATQPTSVLYCDAGRQLRRRANKSTPLIPAGDLVQNHRQVSVTSHGQPLSHAEPRGATLAMVPAEFTAPAASAASAH